MYLNIIVTALAIAAITLIIIYTCKKSEKYQVSNLTPLESRSSVDILTSGGLNQYIPQPVQQYHHL